MRLSDKPDRLWIGIFARPGDLAAGLAVRAGRLQLERRTILRVGAPKAHANDVVSDVDIARPVRRCKIDGAVTKW